MRMIKSLDDLRELKEGCQKVLLLYSGGLDSTFTLVYLREILKVEVVALYVDVGQEESSIDEDIINKFSCEMLRVNGRDEFLNNFVKKAIINQGTYFKRHPLSASLSRPLFAQIAAREAEKRGIEVILHCATKTQNSLRRFNTSLVDLKFKGVFGSPFELSTPDRIQKIDFLKQYGVEFSEERRFSFDTNLWCREFESGDLINPENINIAEQNFKWTKKTEDDVENSIVKIGFKNGVPLILNNEEMPLEDLLLKLNYLAGRYQVGRFCSLEECPTGQKVIEVRECPAALILLDAYWDLLGASCDQELLALKTTLDQYWVRESSEGRWFGEMKEAIESFNYGVSLKVNGEVTYNLAKGSYLLESVISKTPKYLTKREVEEVNFEVTKFVDKSTERLDHKFSSNMGGKVA